jgi:hypothetical protein
MLIDELVPGCSGFLHGFILYILGIVWNCHNPWGIWPAAGGCGPCRRHGKHVASALLSASRTARGIPLWPWHLGSMMPWAMEKTLADVCFIVYLLIMIISCISWSWKISWRRIWYSRIFIEIWISPSCSLVGRRFFNYIYITLYKNG